MLGSVLGAPQTHGFGSPLGVNSFNSNPISIEQKVNNQLAQISAPMENNRVVTYAADYAGCGYWRVHWPSDLLNCYQKMVSHISTVMVLDPRYYVHCSAVRVQRQATTDQLQFMKFLKQISQEQGFRLLYEIDDICFREDIPDYNKFKSAFEADDIRQASMEMMAMCDEITVTCPFMRDYYKAKTGNQNITVIPNLMPKYWFGNFYDEDIIMKNFDKHQKRPRILYAGSGAHFDVDNKVGQKDDFEHVVDAIANTVKDFQWVFLGAFPMRLRPLVEAGLIEFHPWVDLYKYPAKLWSMGVQMMIAPLQDNNFNRAKSDLKFIESSALGIPIACQNMCTYEKAHIKFDTAEQMVSSIKDILHNRSMYRSFSRKGREFAEGRWLEDHIDAYVELFKTPYGSPHRKHLAKWNS